MITKVLYITLTKNLQFHDRTKHVDICLHFIINEVEKDIVKLEKIKTEENVFDFLTKVVPGSKLECCLGLLRLVDHPTKK